MLLKIDGLLSTAEVTSIRTALVDVKFEDGLAIAGLAMLTHYRSTLRLLDRRRLARAKILRFNPIRRAGAICRL